VRNAKKTRGKPMSVCVCGNEVIFWSWHRYFESVCLLTAFPFWLFFSLVALQVRQRNKCKASQALKQRKWGNGEGPSSRTLRENSEKISTNWDTFIKKA